MTEDFRESIDFRKRWTTLLKLIEAERRKNFRNYFFNRATGLDDVYDMMIAISNADYEVWLNTNKEEKKDAGGESR